MKPGENEAATAEKEIHHTGLCPAGPASTGHLRAAVHTVVRRGPLCSDETTVAGLFAVIAFRGGHAVTWGDPLLHGS